LATGLACCCERSDVRAGNRAGLLLRTSRRRYNGLLDRGRRCGAGVHTVDARLRQCHRSAFHNGVGDGVAQSVVRPSRMVRTAVLPRVSFDHPPDRNSVGMFSQNSGLLASERRQSLERITMLRKRSANTKLEGLRNSSRRLTPSSYHRSKTPAN